MIIDYFDLCILIAAGDQEVLFWWYCCFYISDFVEYVSHLRLSLQRINMLQNAVYCIVMLASN